MSEPDSELLVVGRIGGVYGVKGWIRIHSFTEPAENLLDYGGWKIRRREAWETLPIDAGKRHGKSLVAHVSGIDSRDDAEALKGKEIAVPRSALPALEQDEFYWHQLQGLRVESRGELLGRVDHLLETGANDVMVVKPCEGSRDTRERLVPWLRDSVVKRVDLEAGSIVVDWDPEF